MDCPPACYFALVQDGKQEIYLEWPNVGEYERGCIKVKIPVGRVL